MLCCGHHHGRRALDTSPTSELFRPPSSSFYHRGQRLGPRSRSLDLSGFQPEHFTGDSGSSECCHRPHAAGHHADTPEQTHQGLAEGEGDQEGDANEDIHQLVYLQHLRHEGLAAAGPETEEALEALSRIKQQQRRSSAPLGTQHHE
mmetsp:Transcript_25247/g.73756  ORF Transcript_25247/g.73756 Transcript_25247/m.73756 type:complete len:147 (-) Transcript_25247:55-495(-)